MPKSSWHFYWGFQRSVAGLLDATLYVLPTRHLFLTDCKLTRRSDTERQSQTEAPAEVAVESDIINDADNSPALGTDAGLSSTRSDGNHALGAGPSQTTMGSPAPSARLPHGANAQQSGTTEGPNTNGIETNIGHKQDADGDLQLQYGSEPNPGFDRDLLFGDGSAFLNLDGMDFHYDPPIGFQ